MSRVHLTPREQERLTIFTLAELARRRRARGRRLNAPEAVALICDEVLERAWDGASLAEVMETGKTTLGPADVQDGVAGLVPHVQVDVLLPSGTALVAIDAPIAPPDPYGPGAVRTRGGEIALNEHRPRTTVRVRNVGDKTVFISSHFPIAEANAVLELDREAAAGMRPDVPAGHAVSFAPGAEREIDLVSLSPEE